MTNKPEVFIFRWSFDGIAITFYMKFDLKSKKIELHMMSSDCIMHTIKKKTKKKLSNNSRY